MTNKAKGTYNQNPCKEIVMDNRSMMEKSVDDEMAKILKEVDDRLAIEFYDKLPEMVGS